MLSFPISGPIFLLEDLYHFKYFPGKIIWSRVPDQKIKCVLSFCHKLACRGHFGPCKTVKKKCYIVGSIVQLCLKMPLNFVRHVLDAKMIG